MTPGKVYELTRSFCKREEIVESFIEANLENSKECVQVIENTNYLIITSNDKVIEKFANLEVLRHAEEGVSFEKGNVEPIFNYETKNNEIAKLVEDFRNSNSNYSVAYFYDATRYSAPNLTDMTLVVANDSEIVKRYIEPFSDVHQKRFPQASGVIVNFGDYVQESADTTVLTDKEQADKNLEFLFRFLELGSNSKNSAPTM